MTTIYSDVIIVGGGIAGATAALLLTDKGFKIALLVQTFNPLESNTYYAQGGIAYRGKNDSPQQFKKDILNAGGYYNNEEAVEQLVHQGPEWVEKLLIKRLGIPFEPTPIKEGGHSVARILHVKDYTGQVIQKALYRALSTQHIVQYFKGFIAVDLLVQKRCWGILAWDRQQKNFIQFLAPYTVLATGGTGYLFGKTTNPSYARGDGIAMALRADVKVKDLEFIQFHPTALYCDSLPQPLVSAAVRGIGARLRLPNGEPFMHYYEPQWKDLAPRDIVTQSIFKEMQKHQLSHVYLDLCDHLDASTIKERFPSLHRSCLLHGIDITKEWIPVAPAAHYCCGGIEVDLHGRTNLEGLYAIGEVSCTGVHGANRLASTSLLEGLVWAAALAQHLKTPLARSTTLIDVPVPDSKTAIEPTLLQERIKQLQQWMWRYVGIQRERNALKKALKQFKAWEEEAEKWYWEHAPSDLTIAWRNMSKVARAITEHAYKRTYSLGCHWVINDQCR